MALGLTNPALTQGPVTTDDLTGKASKKDLAKALLAANANAASATMNVTPGQSSFAPAPDAAPPAPDASQPQPPLAAAAAPAPPVDVAQAPPGPLTDPNAPIAPPDQSAPDPQAPQMTTTGGGLNMTSPSGAALPSFKNPSYSAASTDPNTGAPTPFSGSLSKLGKLLTVLQMAGQGAAAGSQGHSFGQGFALAQQASDQRVAQHQAQQQHQMSLATQAAQLKMLPIQQKYQQMMLQRDADYKEAQTSAMNAHAAQQTAAAGRQDQLTTTGAATPPKLEKPLLSKNAAGDNVWMQKDPKNPQADENGMVELGPGPSTKPAPPVVKVFGNRSMQWNPATGAWDDKGAAPAERALPGAGTPGPATPVTPELQQQISALPAPQQALLGKYDSKTQSALMAVAHGDQPMSIFPPRQTRGAPGMNQQDAAGIVQQLWPSYRTNLYQTKQKLQDDYTNMKGSGTGAQMGSFNTFLGHAADASDVASHYLQTGSPLLNKSVNWIRSHAAGDPGFTQLQAALYPVREEYLKFIKGNFAPQKEELAAMDRVMSDDSTPAQIQEALKTMGHQAVVRLDSINEGYKTTTGENWPNLIHANRVVSAQKLGLGDAIAGYGTGGQLRGNMPQSGSAATQQQSAAPAGGKASKYGVPISQ